MRIPGWFPWMRRDPLALQMAKVAKACGIRFWTRRSNHLWLSYLNLNIESVSLKTLLSTTMNMYTRAVSYNVGPSQVNILIIHPLNATTWHVKQFLPEVISEVLHHCQPNKVAQVALANHSCQAEAERLLYRDVSLTGMKQSHIAQCLLNLRSPHRATLVCRFSVNISDLKLQQLEHIGDVFELMHGLRHLRISKCNKCLDVRIICAILKYVDIIYLYDVPQIWYHLLTQFPQIHTVHYHHSVWLLKSTYVSSVAQNRSYRPSLWRPYRSIQAVARLQPLKNHHCHVGWKHRTRLDVCISGTLVAAWEHGVPQDDVLGKSDGNHAKHRLDHRHEQSRRAGVPTRGLAFPVDTFPQYSHPPIVGPWS